MLVAMLSTEFSYASFVAVAEHPEALCDALAGEIERRTRGAKHPPTEMGVVIEELRRLGHEIFGFDASPGEWEAFCAWGPTAEKLDYELLVTVTYAAPQSAHVIFQARVKANATRGS